MSLLKRQVINSGTPNWDGGKYEKLARRTSQLDNATLLMFIDNTVSKLGLCYDDVSRHGGQEKSFAELEEGLMSLWAVTQALRSRVQPEV
jgi:hypothetical protein